MLQGEDMEGVGGPCWEEDGDSVCSAGDVVSWISSSWAASRRGSTPVRGPPVLDLNSFTVVRVEEGGTRGTGLADFDLMKTHNQVRVSSVVLSNKYEKRKEG